MNVQDTLFKIESQAKELYEFLNSTTNKTTNKEDHNQVSVLVPVPYPHLYKSQDNDAMVHDLRLQANFIAKNFIELKDRVNFDINHKNCSRELLSYINGGTRIVTILSSVHELLSTALSKSNNDNDSSNKAASWIPPSSFERSTHKYWVSSNNLSEVMLKCIEEVPILMYGKKKK